MKWPWIARDSHDETVKLLQDRIVEMQEERRLLYDRLALIGLGGPLFHLPSAEEIKAEQEENDTKEDEAGQELNRLRSMHGSQRAAAITRKNQRAHNSRMRAASRFAMSAIDEAETLGKTLA